MPAQETSNTSPTTRVQFSSAQLQPIFLGLDDLVQENAYVRATGALRRHTFSEDQHGRFNTHEAPTDEQMSAILSAHSKIQPRLETGGWIRLDHRELAACYLAVSHAKSLVSRKNASAWSAEYKAETDRVRAFIEKHRKRAVKLLPTTSQKTERDKIVADLKNVRQRLAPAVHDNKQPRCLRMMARDVVADAVKLALDGLRMRGYEFPSNIGTVRQKVRACIRNVVRRGGSRRGFLEDQISASLLLADYVIEHSTDLVRRKPADECARLRKQHPQIDTIATSISVNEAQLPIATARRKELPAHVRIACSELEWLIVEALDGQSAWSRMSRAARVDAVAKAKKQGGKVLSNRHIARIVGIDDKTIARMLDEAALPPDVRTQISRGKKSSNQALREAADPVYQQSKRLLRDNKDRSVSAAHAEQIVSYVREHRLSRDAVVRAKELVTGPDSVKRLQGRVPRIDIENAMRESMNVEVTPTPDDLGTEAPAERLRWWLLQVAPEVIIHHRALDKALKALPNRAVYGTKS